MNRQVHQNYVILKSKICPREDWTSTELNGVRNTGRLYIVFHK